MVFPRPIDLLINKLNDTPNHNREDKQLCPPGYEKMFYETSVSFFRLSGDDCLLQLNNRFLLLDCPNIHVFMRMLSERKIEHGLAPMPCRI